MNCPVIELAQQLIRRPSLSPDDAGCQAIISARLQAAGFHLEAMPFADTENLWAWHATGSGPTLLFAGHTDVVPCGNSEQWNSPPFVPTIRDGMLYGRGAADMKGSLAAMIVAAERFVSAHPLHRGRLAFLITSDEEASAVNGTVKVVETLMSRGEKVEYCLVGEPSCDQRLGDIIKNGRRGSVTVDLVFEGKLGHVAYPQLADNPIHRAVPALQELTTSEWDQGNEFFPPTSMQITNIQGGTGSNNVIPGQLAVQINFRFSSEVTADILQQRVERVLKQHQLRYQATWAVSGQPFLTPKGLLVDAMVQAIQQRCGITPKLLTTGGTSDGRFIAAMGAQVAELGPRNATIHQVNECVSIQDLQLLADIYQHIMEQLIL